MTSVLEGVGKDAAYSVFGKLKEWYSYIESYSDNIRALEGKHRELTDLKETINSQLERESDNLRKPTTVTQGWLERVETLLTKEELKQLLDKEIRKRKEQCCFGRMQCNLYHLYDMSKAAENMAKELDAEINKKPDSSMVTEPVSVSDLKSAPGEFLGSLQSRVELMDKILRKLEDDDVDFVGIFGMGAIGKTTLVREISNKAKTKFSKRVMVEISEAPNMERIQYQIAEQLGLNLSEVHSVEHRATQLYNRLIGRDEKILVILDNIWEKLDLAKVGIPQQSEKSSEFCCKLMVTSRKKHVCKVMGVQDTDIFEVHPLDQTEAKLLLRARVGKTVDMNEHDKQVENRILKKCDGLPLSIVLIADVIKDQELSRWEHYAAELEKPSSMHGSIKDANRLTNSILGTSYRLIESEEKRRFFLLACLFPFGSIIRVEDMMRYGIGKGLFQDVNNLTEAIHQANTWANELVSSSLLLPSEYDDYGVIISVEIQDVVRASTIELAKRDGEVFMVEAFPRWRELETCKKYTTISLMSGDDHSRLGGLMSDNNLEMLLLDNTKPPEFDDTFFESMKKLKVLVLSGMNKKKCDEFLRIPTTSTQIWKSSLRTLHLECCELGDITGIGGLINLVVLSLRYSSVVELPGEAIMGNLVKLRLLDLRMCEIRSEGIPANVLGRLSQLEGLYLFDSNIKKWGHNSVQATDSKYASIDELNRLSYLNVLDINVRLEDLPIQGDQFVKNLERFKVRIWNSIIYEGRRDTDWSRSLNLGALDMRSTRTIECVKALLLKTEELILDSVKGFEEQYLQQENEWRNIKKLKISSCYKNVVESIKWLAFPNLENLNLTHLNNSRIIGAGNSTKIFSNLRTLFVWKLENLEAYVLPIHVLPLYHLTSLVVNDCNKLKYIFGEAERETHQKNKDPHPHLKLPLLEHLILEDLNKLESMVEVPNLLGGEASPTLFTTKDKAAFLNLKGLGISGLGKIKSLCPVSVAVVLVHLVSLEIYSCEEMTEAVVKDDDEESDGHGDVVLFPSLDFLKLSDCPKMGQFISAEQSCEFPSLRQLEIWKCDEMQSWSAGPSCRAPNLKHFDYQFGMQSIPEGGELNQFFKDRYQQRTHHPFLSVE